MTVNGEIKALWGMSCIVAVYAIYMTCAPDPEDGILMTAIVSPIVAIVTGVLVKTRTVKK